MRNTHKSTRCIADSALGYPVCGRLYLICRPRLFRVIMCQRLFVHIRLSLHQLLWHLVHIRLGTVPSKDIQTLPPSVLLPFSWTMLNRKKKSIFRFFKLCLIVHIQFTKNLPTGIKKLLKSVQIYRKYADCSENYFFIFLVFFCATFSFWDKVDFVYGRFWCIWPDTSKSTLSQKTKSRTEKSSWTKKSVSEHCASFL